MDLDGMMRLGWVWVYSKGSAVLRRRSEEDRFEQKVTWSRRVKSSRQGSDGEFDGRQCASAE